MPATNDPNERRRATASPSPEDEAADKTARKVYRLGCLVAILLLLSCSAIAVEILAALFRALEAQP